MAEDKSTNESENKLEDKSTVPEKRPTIFKDKPEDKPEQKSKTSVLSIVCIVGILIIVGYLVWDRIDRNNKIGTKESENVDYKSTKAPVVVDKPPVNSMEDKLTKTVIEINKTVPIKLNPDIRIDSAMSLPNTLLYNASFVDLDASLVQSTFIMDTTKKLLDIVCHDPKLLEFINKGVTVTYDLRARNGIAVANVQITLDSCIKHMTSGVGSD